MEKVSAWKKRLTSGRAIIVAPLSFMFQAARSRLLALDALQLEGAEVLDLGIGEPALKGVGMTAAGAACRRGWHPRREVTSRPITV